MFGGEGEWIACEISGSVHAIIGLFQPILTVFYFINAFQKMKKIYSVSPPLNRTKEIEEELTLLEGGKQRKPTLMIFISIMAFIGNPARSPMNNQNGPHILISPFAQISQTCFHNFPPSLL